MQNFLLTKLRLKQERAYREMREAQELAYQKRMVWERVWLEYLDEAECSGLCRFCLKPKNEGKHEGGSHMALAAAQEVERNIPNWEQEHKKKSVSKHSKQLTPKRPQVKR